MEFVSRITAAMQNTLAAIRQAAEKFVGIFATDIMQNVKYERYNPAATAGECTPIAYDSKDIATAFFGIIEHVLTNGQDMEYQPQIGISDELKGCKALLFTHNQVTPRDEANMIVKHIPEAMPFDELCFDIGTAIQEIGAKVVVIDDVAGYAKESCRQILYALDGLAHLRDVMILAGFMLNDEAGEISTYLATHAHNLWQLTAGSLNMKNDDGETSREQRYFCLSYGTPTPKRVYYGIDEQGNAIIPSELWKLLRIKELAQMYARQWISVELFTHVAYGPLQGEFAKGSIKKAINEAAACGIIQKSGSGYKDKLILSDGKMSKNLNAGNIAITALGNPYTNPNKTKQRKPILKFGEFKLIAPESGCGSSTMQNFVISMMGAVVTGSKYLDFDIKAANRNTLAIIVGNDAEAVKRLTATIQGFGGDAAFEAIALPQGTTDEAFLTAYKQAIDSTKPDFVFVMCHDRIKPNIYTAAQLAKEVAIYAKRKGICVIAQSNEETGRDQYEFAGDEYWSIAPLVMAGDRNDIYEENGIIIPPIYSFKGSVGSFDFLCRFWDVAGKWKHGKVTAEEQKRAFLIGTFYWCNDTQCCAPKADYGENTISTDCTGNPLTTSTIYQAHKLGLIKVQFASEKKKWLESRVTFNSEAARRLMDK